jgi:hypothetical protein
MDTKAAGRGGAAAEGPGYSALVTVSGQTAKAAAQRRAVPASS